MSDRDIRSPVAYSGVSEDDLSGWAHSLLVIARESLHRHLVTTGYSDFHLPRKAGGGGASEQSLFTCLFSANNLC